MKKPPGQVMDEMDQERAGYPIKSRGRDRAERKVQIGTVNMAPTWGEYLPTLLDFHAHGNVEQRETAHKELTKMATAADAYNAMQMELTKAITLSTVALMELGGKL